MFRIKKIVFISILALLTACNSDDFEEHEIGGNIIDQSTRVFLIDTFTVNSSTVKLDSVKTSGFTNVLLGKYNDPYFGNVKSDVYGEVGLSDPFLLRTSNGETVHIEFDSLVFIMYHEPSRFHFVGDTVKEQTISIHRVIEKFDLSGNKDYYQAHDTLAYLSDTLGIKTFTPRLSLNSVIETIKDADPVSKRGGLRIKLDDALGIDIVNRVNNADEILKERVRWLNYFKGIVLKASDSNSAIFSFQTGKGMKMRLYYHDKKYEQAGVLRFRDFPVIPSNLNFTNHTADFMSEEYPFVQKINKIDEIIDDLSSEQTNNLCFLQGGTGLMVKLRIPHIELLNRIGLTGGILKAEIVFSPEDNSYDKKLYPLPYSAFELYKTNKNNLLGEIMLNAATKKPLVSKYIYNSEYINESYYSFDVTSYVNDILLNGQDYDDALLITLPMATLGNSVERLVIDNDKKSNTRIKLKVTYVVQYN